MKRTYQTLVATLIVAGIAAPLGAQSFGNAVTIGDGEITGAEREIQAEGSVWEVKFRKNGRDGELLLDASGTVRETERELTRDEAPAAVIEAAMAAIEGGAFKSG